MNDLLKKAFLTLGAGVVSLVSLYAPASPLNVGDSLRPSSAEPAGVFAFTGLQSAPIFLALHAATYKDEPPVKTLDGVASAISILRRRFERDDLLPEHRLLLEKSSACQSMQEPFKKEDCLRSLASIATTYGRKVALQAKYFFFPLNIINGEYARSAEQFEGKANAFPPWYVTTNACTDRYGEAGEVCQAMNDSGDRPVYVCLNIEAGRPFGRLAAKVPVAQMRKLAAEQGYGFPVMGIYKITKPISFIPAAPQKCDPPGRTIFWVVARGSVTLDSVVFLGPKSEIMHIAGPESLTAR